MPAQAADEISLEVDGKNFRFWTEITVSLRIDGFDSVSFVAPFDPSSRESRDMWRPFSYRPVRVLAGGVLLFTGVMVGISPGVTADAKIVTVECYSSGAVLQDTAMPATAFPLEFSKLTLKQIAEKMTAPFGVPVSISGPDGSKFDKVKIKISDKVAPFLADLAKQRGYILSSTHDGGIVFRTSQSEPTPPVARLHADKQPVIGVSPTFSPQTFYSEVTCVTKGKRGRKGSQYTEGNFFLQGVTRPGVIELDDTDPGDIEIATRAAIGRMYGNAASYEVELSTWLRPDGELYMPDDFVTLTAPGAMVYQESDLLVRAVELHQTKDRTKTSKLNLMLPGAFSGDIPETVPWEE